MNAKNRFFYKILWMMLLGVFFQVSAQKDDSTYGEARELNSKANGFKGIWYMNQPSNDEYVYKYSGGMATYTAKHRPLSIYSKEADKTFFCFGGTNNDNTTLFHNVSYFDHKTGKVANPTMIIDKNTVDAHDNPVISIDDEGYIWIFSTSHGLSRPSYIYKSRKPYSIKKFQKINATEMVDGKEKPFDNFSYFQVWHVKGKGFMALFTKYQEKFGKRVIGYNTSKDGKIWNEWKELAYIGDGHYQISGETNGKISVAFNYHPVADKRHDDGTRYVGLNYRTNLYYMETKNLGETWHTIQGKALQLPLEDIKNPALIKDFEAEGLNCYLKDINFDKNGNPIILVITSTGYQAGPRNNPRTWQIFNFDKGWKQNKITISDNNYDMGSVYIEASGTWRIIGPTASGTQKYNPGGEIQMWVSEDQGKNWGLKKDMTMGSSRNHTYVRRPVNAVPGFYGMWADGHGRQPSRSQLYFCDQEGNVFVLPRNMKKKKIVPELYNSQ